MKFWVTKPRLLPNGKRAKHYGYRTVIEHPDEKRALKELFPKWSMAGTGRTSEKATAEWLEDVRSQVERRVHTIRMGMPVTDLRPWVEHVASYLEWGRVRGGLQDTGWTAGTAAHKVTYVKYWTDTLQPETLADVSREAVSRAVTAMRTEGLANTTINCRLDAITGLMAWAKEHALLSVDPLEGFPRLTKITEQERGHFVQDELHQLFTETPIEDSLVYQLAHFCRYRESELHALTTEDVLLPWGLIKASRSQTKNKRNAYQPLPDHLVPILWEWLQGRPKGSRLLLMSRNHPERRLYAHMARLGIPKVRDGHPRSFHSFGHSTATHMAQAGAPVALIQKHMRHADAKTTLGYIHAETGEARKMLNLMAARYFPQAYAESRNETLQQDYTNPEENNYNMAENKGLEKNRRNPTPSATKSQYRAKPTQNNILANFHKFRLPAEHAPVPFETAQRITTHLLHRLGDPRFAEFVRAALATPSDQLTQILPALRPSKSRRPA